jgi:hypothetical protein
MVHSALRLAHHVCEMVSGSIRVRPRALGCGLISDQLRAQRGAAAKVWSAHRT